MIRALLAGCCLLLSACAGQTPLPPSSPELVARLPLTLHIQRQQATERQDWLLVLQGDAASLRWSLLDPLGVPLARQRLTAGVWRSVGVLPPNPEARELFAALLFALSSDAAVAQHYPPGLWQLRPAARELAPHWQIDYRSALVFSLDNRAGVRYYVTPVAAQEGL